MGTVKSYMKTALPLKIKKVTSLLKIGNYVVAFEELPEIHKDIIKWSTF